jgi:hypothetical protein
VQQRIEVNKQLKQHNHVTVTSRIRALPDNCFGNGRWHYLKSTFIPDYGVLEGKVSQVSEDTVKPEAKSLKHALALI